MPAAVIFDMDGLMIDSEPIWFDSWRVSMARFGVPYSDELALSFVGCAPERVREIVDEAYHGDPAALAAFEDHYDVARATLFESGAPKKPGLDELLALLAERDVPMAVASSSARALIESILGRIGVLDYFDCIVAGDDGYPSKPAPDVFLAAARGLGADPATTLVLEDAPAGLRAAHAGGFLPVMVPDLTQPTDEVRALCHRVCASLLEVRDLVAAGEL